MEYRFSCGIRFFYHKFVFHEHSLIEKKKKSSQGIKNGRGRPSSGYGLCKDGSILGKVFCQGSKILLNPELSPGSVGNGPVGEQGWRVCGTLALLAINS